MNNRWEEDDKMLFDRVQDMQLDEAEMALKTRIAELTDSIRYAENNTEPFRRLVNARDMLKIELHRVCTINNTNMFKRAVVAVVGQEVYEQILIQLEFERGLYYATPEQRTHEIKVVKSDRLNPDPLYGKLVPIKKK